MSPVDQKVIDEKIQTGKPLDKDEQKVFLAQEGPVDGYEKNDVVDISVKEFDETDETQTGDEKTKAVTDEAKAKETVAAKEREDTDKKVKEELAKKAVEEKSGKKDFFVKVEESIAADKPELEGEEYSQREKAYYRQMRLDRKNRQRAEEERDAAKLRELRLKKDLEEAKKPKEEVFDPVAELKKKDPTDYMTVAEVTALIEKVSAKKEPIVKEEKEEKPTVDPRQLHYFKMCEKEAREAHPEDFDIVMELTEEIINNNQNHLTNIAQAMVAGENPALKAYELIKADPEYFKLLPIAQTKVEARGKPVKKSEEKPPQKSAEEIAKEKRAKESEEALEKNKSKTKTTGHIESHGDTGDEPSFDEIATMSDREFSKLPRKIRQKYLKEMEEI